MKFSTTDISSITEAPSLIEDIAFLTNCDTTTYPYADRLRSLNAHYYKVVSIINKADGIWPWDDTNKTDLPIGVDDLVDSQQNYALPSDLTELIRVEVMNSNGDYEKIYPIIESEINSSLAEYYETAGMPVYFRTIANEIELYPKPSSSNVTLTNGLKVYYKRLLTEFTKSDTTAEPGFDERFHRVLSLGASLDYFLKYPDPQRQAGIEKRYREMLADIEYHYSRKIKSTQRITMKRRAFE